jgi:hypothetical protein
MSKQEKKPGDGPRTGSEPPTSIGVATMLENGTISLLLRAEGPGGAVGDAVITYERSNPKYAEILKHVGGLKVGEEKPVPPFS